MSDKSLEVFRRESKASSSSSTPVAAIVGGISAGLIFFFFLGVVVWRLRQRERRTQPSVEDPQEKPVIIISRASAYSKPAFSSRPADLSRQSSVRTCRTDTTESFFPSSTMLPSPTVESAAPAAPPPVVVTLPMGMNDPSFSKADEIPSLSSHPPGTRPVSSVYTPNL